MLFAILLHFASFLTFLLQQRNLPSWLFQVFIFHSSTSKDKDLLCESRDASPFSFLSVIETGIHGKN
jgi:hypothetical protein